MFLLHHNKNIYHYIIIFGTYKLFTYDKTYFNGQMENQISSEYHTISIRNNLPKYYSEEPLQDLPPNDFWINKLDSSITTGKYQIQYNIINGPCKFTFRVNS